MREQRGAGQDPEEGKTQEEPAEEVAGQDPEEEEAQEGSAMEVEEIPAGVNPGLQNVFNTIDGLLADCNELARVDPRMSLQQRIGQMEPKLPEHQILCAVLDHIAPPPMRSSQGVQLEPGDLVSSWEQFKKDICWLPDGSGFLATVFPTTMTEIPMRPVNISADGRTREYSASRGVKYCLALKNFMHVGISLEPFYVANDGTESSESRRDLPPLGESMLKLESKLDDDEDEDGWRVKTANGSVVLEVRYRAQ